MSYTGAIPDTLTRTSDWLALAPCNTDPDAMFDTTTAGIEAAKTVCGRCVAIERCLQWALETGEEHGVWGGLSDKERRQLRRRAARPISIDDYTGTPKTRTTPGLTLQQVRESNTLPDGEHLLWTGPKVIYRPGETQTTPNRLSFYLDRGRWPEGDTKRTCPMQGCVKPSHLDDRTEREKAKPGKDAFKAVLDSNTVRVFGGHLDWTGPRKPYVQGREYTPRQIAFIIDRGRPPEGSVRTDCTHRGCLLPAHLSDQEERGGCGTRNGYRWHRSRGEEACAPCKQANTDGDNLLRRTGTTKAAA